MSDSALSALPADVVEPTGFLRTLLLMSQTAVAVLRPLYAADNATIHDFAWVSLNPAGQRMLALPACPTESLLTLYPHAQAPDGDFLMYRRAFATGELNRNQTNYQADGVDGYFVTVAQRYENVLVVNFTDTNDQDRSAVELALRDSQVREQAALAEAEQQQALLYSVFEHAPAMICILQGPQHVFQFANAPYRALMGGRPLMGRPFAEALPELAGQGIFEPLDEVYRTGKSYLVSEQPTQLDDDNTSPLESAPRYYNLVWQARRDRGGAVDGVLVFAYDVTPQVLARRQVEHLNQVAEAARAEAEAERQRLYQVLMRLPANIALLRGPQHVYDFVNPEYERLFPERSPLGRPLRQVIPELDGQGYYELFDQVYETGEPFYQAESEAWADFVGTGELERRYYRTSFEPIRDAQGRVTEVLNFAVDVTEQVLARQQVEQLNQQLAQNQAFLQQILQQLPAGVAAFEGATHRFSFVNDRYQRLAANRVVVGRPVAELFPEIADQGLITLLDQVRTTGRPYLAFDSPARLDNATTGESTQLYLDIVYQPLFDEQQQVTSILAFLLNVTEKVESRQQVQQLNQQLEARVQARTEELAVVNEKLTASNAELHESNTQLTRTNVDLDNFIYTASHDLKAPITNIEGLLLALEHELPAVARTGDVSQMLTMMQDAIERFRRTIVHLTDLSRLQKEHSLDADAVALAPVVEAVRLDIAPLLAHTQGQLTVAIPASLTVTFSEKNLRSVVYNLLSNAFKYHHPDRTPEVQLRSWLADGYTVLEVQDNGLGLDLARGQEQLFGMFQRLHTHVEGTGVGLYMVKRIVENAAGRVEVSSELGQGTTFRVFFRY